MREKPKPRRNSISGIRVNSKEVDAKRKQNKDEEWAFLRSRDEHKKSKNPWEKIIDNVEIDARRYIGNKDVSRMRQAMIARKQDLKKM